MPGGMKVFVATFAELLPLVGTTIVPDLVWVARCQRHDRQILAAGLLLSFK